MSSDCSSDETEDIPSTFAHANVSRKRSVLDEDTYVNNKKLKFVPSNSTSSMGECSRDSASSSLEDDEYEKVLFFGKFFEVIKMLNTSDFERNRKGVLVECTICKKKLRGSLQVTSNFIRHLRVQHEDESKQYQKLKVKNKKRKQSNQNYFQKLTVQFIANNMLPISIVEDKAFKDFVCYANPKLSLMSRQTTVKMIDNSYLSMTAKIKESIAANSYFCTTADVWSTKHRSFFGYTCHWLDESLRRKSVALGCKRFTGSHSYDRINDLIMEIHKNYGLNCRNVRATVTDNGSNFVKAFKEFGIQNVMTSDNAILVDEDGEDTEELEIPEFASSLFDNSLPKHIRCATHTLHLLASSDFTRILKDNTSNYEKHKNIMQKCSNLWNKVNRPKSSEQIIEVLGSQLKYPVVTRWNSLYDSIKVLIAHKANINELCTRFDIHQFHEKDFQYLEEYLHILQPISEALDFLQGDNDVVYGYLLPTLASLRVKFYKLRSKSTSKQLIRTVNMLEEALQERFVNYFNLNEEIYDAIVASVLCPAVKLKWITALNPLFNDGKITEVSDIVRKLIFDEWFLYSDPSQVNLQARVSESLFFDFSLTDEPMSPEITSQENEYFSYLADPSTSIEVLHKYPNIKKAYIKFNTPLPSSAAVERLFSFAALINTARRGCLSDSNFEKLLLLKVNN